MYGHERGSLFNLKIIVGRKHHLIQDQETKQLFFPLLFQIEEGPPSSYIKKGGGGHTLFQNHSVENGN